MIIKLIIPNPWNGRIYGLDIKIENRNKDIQ